MGQLNLWLLTCRVRWLSALPSSAQLARYGGAHKMITHLVSLLCLWLVYQHAVAGLQGSCLMELKNESLGHKRVKWRESLLSESENRKEREKRKPSRVRGVPNGLPLRAFMVFHRKLTRVLDVTTGSTEFTSPSKFGKFQWLVCNYHENVYNI